jgi:molybdopterin molybdotransferase
MLDFYDARRCILQHTAVLPAQQKYFTETQGNILAENIVTTEAIPRFDFSAVDGFAVRSAEVTSQRNSLQLQGIIRAGDSAVYALKKKNAYKILTGAPVPKYADAIVMKEHCEEQSNTVTIHKKTEKGENIRERGGEFSKGALVLSAGTVITPPVIGMLATCGRTKIKVYRMPNVAILVTGNELQSPHAKLKRGQIHNSNLFTLVSSLQAMGINPVFAACVRDDERSMSNAFTAALKKADVVISSGGVSVGETDFVKHVLKELRVTQHFWGIAMKPGKPNFFGTKGKKLVFGLPGNPVAALLSFLLLVKPALDTMCGKNSTEEIFSATVAEPLVKKAGRMEFVRGKFFRDEHGKIFVRATKGQDSHMLSGLTSANCLIHFPKEKEKLEKEESVAITPLAW